MADTIRFALATYKLSSSQTVTVEVSKIKDKVNNKIIDFRPNHKRDYVAGKYYYIKEKCDIRGCEKEPEEHRHWFKLYILRLGGKFKINLEIYFMFVLINVLLLLLTWKLSHMSERPKSLYVILFNQIRKRTCIGFIIANLHYGKDHVQI